MTLLAEINALCLKRLGRLPNIDNPQGYNDIIQWLKLNDQTPEHVAACDKYQVRDLVEARTGAETLIPLLYSGPRYRPSTTFPHIAKASHDSGSAIRVTKREQYAAVHARMTQALGRTYGIGKGEWAYRLIKGRRVIVESCLPDPVIDYKFHCSGGQVRWLQVISERGNKHGPAEAIFDPAGAITDLHMDQNMRHVPNPNMLPGDYEFSVMTDLAEILCAGWRYVRVDLYWTPDGPKFGELTFWPLAGCYKTKDEPKFGELLRLDFSDPSPPIVA
jgi:hypothetical protein